MHTCRYSFLIIYSNNHVPLKHTLLTHMLSPSLYSSSSFSVFCVYLISTASYESSSFDQVDRSDFKLWYFVTVFLLSLWQRCHESNLIKHLWGPLWHSHPLVLGASCLLVLEINEDTRSLWSPVWVQKLLNQHLNVFCVPSHWAYSTTNRCIKSNNENPHICLPWRPSWLNPLSTAFTVAPNQWYLHIFMLVLWQQCSSLF